jgi:hypothetical protein
MYKGGKMATVAELINLKSTEEKEKLLDWLGKEQVTLTEGTKEEIADGISCFKNFLNNELKVCENLVDVETNTNYFISLLNAKNQKIDKLVDLYNESNTYNKIKFVDNAITFDKITTIETIRVEIDDFDYLYPIGFTISFTTFDGEIITKDIIPFNYNGLYNEFINLSETVQSTFKVANRKDIYFYSCEYNEKYYSLGSELTLVKGKHYDFSTDGYIVFDTDVLSDNQIIMKYQPNENSFELEINKKIVSVALTPVNDFLSISDTYTKRLVINE